MIPISHVVTHDPPKNWRTVPFWSLFRRGKKTGYPEEELLSVYRDFGVIPKSSRDDNHNKESEDLSGYQLVTKGALVTNKMKAWQGSIAISRYQGIVSPAYYVYTPLSKECDQYLHYLLRSAPYIAVYGQISKGVRVNQWDLEHEALRIVPVLLPDLTTQRQIADFLDRETARIDLLIEKKQRLVALLGEKYFASLEQLTFPKKDSLISELIPFRWVCRIAEGQVDPTSESWKTKALIAPNHIESKTGRLLKIESAEEQGAISGKYSFNKGTVIYSKIRPALAKACIAPQAGMCSADMYPIIPDKRLLPDFLLMQLLSARFTDWATLESMRVAMPKINRETLGGFKLRVPAITEQEVAVKEFKNNKAIFQSTTDAINGSIDRLKEYRAAIIAAAVTGQIDVTTYSNSGTADCQLDATQEEAEGTTEYVVPFDEKYSESLLQSINIAETLSRPSNRSSNDYNEFLVAKYKNLKIEIFSNEHPPPHFRVKLGRQTANFAISDCETLNGSREVLRYRREIRKWWKSNKGALIDTWNSRRPSDCTVGEYRE